MSELKTVQVDTIYLLGGPLVPNLGDFEDEDGLPSMDGWFDVDITEQVDSPWHIDTFNCADLDPTQPGNHAWWCGREYPSCEPGDMPGGYSNDWYFLLEWLGTVPDPTSDVTVRVTAVMNYDVEPGYDYLYLDAGSTWGVSTFNGSNQDEFGVFVPVEFETSFTLTPADYLGANSDQAYLRWRFESDFAWSDTDCLWPTEGAAQIDLIAVYFDQGEGEFQVGTTETCEDGDPVQWGTAIMPGCGSFAAVWPILADLDPCRGNTTPQVAFIDDGQVVPGTGGYLCTTWCYGPSGYIVNPEGGRLGPPNGIKCEIWSPVLEWPEGGYDGAILSYDGYRHEKLGPTWPAVCFRYRLRSTDDPLSTAEWYWNGWVTFGGPDYFRRTLDVTDDFEPGRTHAQISLGIWDIPDWPGTDGTPAPYFDNVSFKVFTYSGPSLSIGTPNLAQDNFPEIGAIDYGNLGANHVRFDAGWYDEEEQTIQDVIWFSSKPVRTGSVLAGHPRMYYKLQPNPLFDPYRTSGLPNEGFVEADSARWDNGQAIAGAWVVDLPDTAFFYPGDVIHYYLEAQDDLSGDIGTTILPEDTTGFGTLPGDPGYVPMLYSEWFVVRALPSLTEASPGSQPAILLYDDGYSGGEWTVALGNLGYAEGIDYDKYFTHNGSRTSGNAGMGPRATATQLAHYTTLLYASGDLDFWTLLEEDVSLLDSWLTIGNKNMFITGNSFAYDMFVNGSGNMYNFMNNWVSVNFLQSDVSSLIENQTTALVRAVPGNPIFYAVDEWLAAGSCPEQQQFDAVQPAGNAVSIAEFTNPSGQGGVYPYAAATYYHNENHNTTTIYMPYDFQFIWTPQSGGGLDPVPSATRTHMLNDILFAFGHSGSSLVTDVPDGDEFAVKSYPNPFNPSTKIAYHMPRRGELSIKIYNIRGELVRTLIDAVVTAGEGFVMWDGTDRRGQAVASGVYFYETQSLGQTYVNKLALVK